MSPCSASGQASLPAGLRQTATGALLPCLAWLPRPAAGVSKSGPKPGCPQASHTRYTPTLRPTRSIPSRLPLPLQVLERDGGNLKALYRRAQAYMATADYVEAEQDIRKGLIEVRSCGHPARVGHRLVADIRETGRRASAALAARGQRGAWHGAAPGAHAPPALPGARASSRLGGSRA